MTKHTAFIHKIQENQHNTTKTKLLIKQIYTFRTRPSEQKGIAGTYISKFSGNFVMVYFSVEAR
jgi:hypothetical protein